MLVLLVVIIGLFILYRNGSLDFSGTNNYKVRKSTRPNKSDTVDDIDDTSSLENMPYNKKKYFHSKSEMNFYRVLDLSIKDMDVVIYAKVRLADIVYISKTDKRQHYFNRIRAKHVDYLLCDSKYHSPLLAIELDDSSHNTSKRKERDEFVDAVFRSANMPILHVKASRTYSPSELKLMIDKCINPKVEVSTEIKETIK